MTSPPLAVRYAILALSLTFVTFSQDTAAGLKTPLDHVIGTISAVDRASQTVTVIEDKTNASHVVQLANTKTLLKVEPAAKDLKNAVRITAADLEVGDRVDVRGAKEQDAPANLAAKSIILMSGRALAATHEEQAAAWAKATSAKVTAVDTAAGTITADVRSVGAVQSVTVKTGPGTEFTRYSPETGKPIASQIAEIQTGDQLKIIGDKTDNTITAQRVYSGAFRTMSMTVTSLAADGKSITGKDLTTKKEVVVDLTSNASIHKLPPMMAAMMARRLNPGAAPTTPGGASGVPPAGAPPSGVPPAGVSPAGVSAPYGAAGGTPGNGPGGGPAGGAAGGRGDISQMIQHTPTITLADIKPGDALVISGVATGTDSSRLMATSIVAGVEPILQSAPASQRSGGRNAVGSDWGLGEMAMPQ